MSEQAENNIPVTTKGQLQRIIEATLQVFGISDFVTYAQVLRNVFFVLTIIGIGVVEIFNTHWSERMMRKIEKQTEHVKELRWEYMTVKTNMNQKAKQSELQKILEPYGLRSLQEPPKKIEVKKEVLEKKDR
jgi:Bacteriodetes cell division protein (FtsL-like)